MPWENKPGEDGGGDGGGRGRGPWGGQGPGGGSRGGGGGPQPPDLEELLKRGQARLKQMLPGGSIGPLGIAAAIAILVLGWFLTGLYRVEADEQGVVKRFGAFTALTNPGLNYHLPWPIETAEVVRVTRENQISVGFSPAADGGTARNVPDESLMLTGDENIVDIEFTVVWQVKDAADFLFNVQAVEETIKAIAESAMREVVGRNLNQKILTEDRGRIQDETRVLMQTTLDAYGAGVIVNRVQLQRVDPPRDVIESFREVQAARADLEKSRNVAQTYANKIIPEARGFAEQTLRQAEGYKQEVIARAQGEASRFLAVLTQYLLAREVTRERIFLETMERVLGGANKVIIDGGSAGVLPYLPLDGLRTTTPNRSDEGTR